MEFPLWIRHSARIITPNASYLRVPPVEKLRDAIGPEAVGVGAHDGAVQRPALFYPSRGLTIIFATLSVDILKSPTSDAEQAPASASAFAAEAAEIFERIMADTIPRATRVALTSDEFLTETGPELDALAPRLLKIPPALAARGLTEWDWRLVARDSAVVGAEDEPFNLIAIIKRNTGLVAVAHNGAQGVPVPFDRAALQIDVNTLPDREVERFPPSGMRGLFATLASRHDSLRAAALGQARGEG